MHITCRVQGAIQIPVPNAKLSHTSSLVHTELFAQPFVYAVEPRFVISHVSLLQDHVSPAGGLGSHSSLGSMRPFPHSGTQPPAAMSHAEPAVQNTSLMLQVPALHSAT